MVIKFQKVVFVSLTLLLMLITSALGVRPVHAKSDPSNGILNPNGTLNLEANTFTSFQAEDWDVQLDPQLGPIFSPMNRTILSPSASSTIGNWSALGSNPAGTDGAISDLSPFLTEVNSFAVVGTDIYIGGCFQNVGGEPTADYIAKWDTITESWSGIGNDGTATPNGALKSCIRALAVDGENIYVGGYPTLWVNGAPVAQGTYAAKWNGTSWSSLGTSFGDQVTSFAIIGNDVYVGGHFTGYIRKWDGVSWTTPGGNSSLNQIVERMEVINSDLYVGGSFTEVRNGSDLVPEAAYIAKWNGSTWSALGSNGTASGGPLNNSISGLATDGTNLYVAGRFTDINNYGTILPAADYVAKWNGTDWSALGDNGSGNGVFASNTYPIALQSSSSDLYMVGLFTDINNHGTVLVAADYIAKWDTLTGNWSALGSNAAGNGSLNQVGLGLGMLGDNLLVGGRFTNVNNNGIVLTTADYIAAYGIDANAPMVNSFVVTSPSTSLNIPITAFTASDDVAVTGYLITTSSIPPSAGAAGWTGSAPATFTVASQGSHTLYPWVKDAAGNVSAVYGSPISVSVDTTAPAVTSFTAPSLSASFDIPITAFTASDNVSVTGYKITTSSTPPVPGAAGWTASAPTTYSVVSIGSYSLYPWAKDAAGNVSAVYGSPVSVSVDTSAPTVTSFTALSLSNSRDVPITAFSASDDIYLTSYMITESSTAPTAGDSGWSDTAPTTYTVGADGNYILYPWAKDAAGNVSAVYGSPSSVIVDAVAPSITSFTVPSSSNSLDISITAFTASDNVGVIGYLITESSTTPAAADSGWTASAPTTYSVVSIGSYTLYPWVKDAAGNVSAVFGSPASVSVDTSAPIITSFAATSPSTSLAISITAFTASDTIGIGGYLITESAAPPSAGDANWTSSAPTIYTVTSEGSYTLYPWVKDATDHISAVFASPAIVTINLPDTTAPVLSSITRKDPAVSLTNADTLVFRATFSEAVQNVDVADFTVNGTTTATVTGISNVDNAVYDVTVSGGDLTGFEGIVGLNLSGSQNIQDLVGNSLPADEPATDETYLLVQSFTVTKAADTDDGICDSDCSLREAINAANGSDDVSEITFAANYTITLNGSQLPVITTSITISGNGAENTIIQADANPNTATHRIFEVNAAGDLTLKNLTVRNGRCNGACSTFPFAGGGILNDGGVLMVTKSTLSDNSATGGGGISNAEAGALTVTNSTFSGNSAITGGGILNSGHTLTVTNSTFSGNTGTSNTSNGGGIYTAGGTPTVTNSTFSGNSASTGGGIYNIGGVLIVANSTFSTNSASVNGGAIYNNASGTLVTNSTFSANSASSGGGIYNTTGSTTLYNTIVAGSPNGFNCVQAGGTLTANGFNADTDGSCDNAAQLTSAQINLQLLGDNGGPTQTMALSAGSPAIDAGDDVNCPTADQRGVTRPQGSHCDIGAYEIEFTDIDVYIGASGTPIASYSLLPGATVTPYYDGVVGGPVRVTSTNGENILASEHRNYQTSFSETLGYPDNQLTTAYWFTRYAYNANVKTWLLVTNPSGSNADVEIYIGDLTTPIDSFTLTQGSAVSKFYDGLANGPVLVKSTNGVEILASEHRNYQTSFSETLGYPADQLTTAYWFTRYAYNANVKTWLLVTNPSNSSANVEVYIGDLTTPIDSFSLTEGTSVSKFYNGIANGPVLVKSTNGVDILASEHRNYQTSFSETLGYPADQLTTEYWFTRYTYNANVKTWLLIANPDPSQTAEVSVYIGTSLKPIASYSIGHGQTVTPFYDGVAAGPVRVVSMNGVNILASVHRNYRTSFSETLGYPADQLTTEYWFTRYAYNANVKTWLLIANPQ